MTQRTFDLSIPIPKAMVAHTTCMRSLIKSFCVSSLSLIHIYDEQVFRTRGLDADQTEAAIKATMKMLNLIEDEYEKSK